MDNKKIENMCLILPTLRELEKKQQALKMRKKERFCKL
jgi:hypothetical protein